MSTEGDSFVRSVADIPPLPVVPSPSAPDELRIATKGDLNTLKDDVRREMKLWVGLGVAGGNVAAAFVVSAFKQGAAHSAIQAVIGLFT